MTSPVSRPPVRYYGSKWRLAQWIIQQFPPHACYVEPYAGGASCLFQKYPARFEVLNDLNSDVVNFFEVLRATPEALIRAIELTPYSREELRLARTRQATDDPLEKARRFYIRCWQSFGSGAGTSSTGWRYQIGAGGKGSGASAIRLWNTTDHLYEVAARLKWVQIECKPALETISRFDSLETLFYCDPPYVHSTRYADNDGTSKGYSHEMTDSDHRALADTLRYVSGMVIVSGYPSALYDELYGDWKRISTESNDLTGKKQTECLWLSPRVSSIQALPLFANMLGGDRD